VSHSFAESLPTTPTYLDDLNVEQRTAVEAIEGPVLILAGAGTGKTRVLTTRLVHILARGMAYPSQILAVTFTNKAAAEMRERVSTLVGRPTEGLWLATFHATAVRILRRHAELVGLKTNFTILNTDDQQRLIKQILQAEGIDDGKNPPRMVVSIISSKKDRVEFATPFRELSAADGWLDRVYSLYQDRLRTLNAVDFGDLLLYCIKLFQDHPDVLQSYQNQFRYIMVDEYQDTNVAQYLWLRLLAQQHNNICCVGDDDQSIYGWRGAEIGNILRFEKDFPGAKVIRLEQNYRSTTHILGAASGLIEKNKGRLGKTLWTETDGGEKVLIRGTWDSEDEARFIGDEVEAAQRQQVPLCDMAVLVRAGFQTREFEDRFLTLGIPYKVIGGLRFYERQEIRDAMAYLRLAVQPDDGLAFERIINTPRRGIGTTTLQLLHKYARENQESLPQAARILSETDTIRGGARTALRTFFRNLDHWGNALQRESHVEVVKMILDESGYTHMWREDKSPDAPGRLENLKELVRAIEEFETLGEFLDHVSLVMDATKQDQTDMITIMTLHAAKGLEFDTAFLAGWEESLFPHPRAMEEKGQEGLEEERRLAYVGITRAKRQAIITFSLNRRTYQGWQHMLPSRFIKELPPEHITLIQPNGTQLSAPASSPASPTRAYVIEGEYSDIPLRPHHGFQASNRVFHQKFGYGRIIAINGEQLEIEFDHSGIKKVMADFVEKE
jgi:DNA helicase-2/ATP-dependent DNA helicase PcrA